ncbi:hypothetical protein [Nonlabens sp.]|uniref:hypothetical protein n=1 Tax=Nonlabens sp. TaxID=1888209 RepID=UPI001BCDA887|nr:hypothetical protein [Nonlabens sp.]
MDQLDILKQNWQSQTDNSPRFTKEQLTGLLARTSSGIVKWLLIIAMIEFVVFIVLGLVSHLANQENHTIEMMGAPFYYGSMIFHYVVIITFIYVFYSNYKHISISQPTSSLMNKILKTRRTMKWYIWYNLTYMMLVGMIATVLVIPNDPKVTELLASPEMAGHETAFYLMALGASFIVFLIICVVMYLIYQLIYGILLRKLQRNYNELKRMEI